MIYFIFWVATSALLIIFMLTCPWVRDDYVNGKYLNKERNMNIKDQTKSILYHTQNKLINIREDIESQIKRVDNELFVETDSHSLAELHDLRAQLEGFYQRLDPTPSSR